MIIAVRAFAFNQTLQFITVPVVAFISYLLVPTNVFGWGGLALGGGDRLVGAVFIWFIRIGLPDRPVGSPSVAAGPRPTRSCRRWKPRCAPRPQELPAPRLVSGEVDEQKGSWSEISHGVYRGRTIMLLVFNLLQTIGYTASRAGCRRS